MRLDSSSSPTEGVVIELLEPLFGVKGATEKIYVRDIMPGLVQRITSWLESDAPYSAQQIAGMVIRLTAPALEAGLGLPPASAYLSGT